MFILVGLKQHFDEGLILRRKTMPFRVEGKSPVDFERLIGGQGLEKITQMSDSIKPIGANLQLELWFIRCPRIFIQFYLDLDWLL